MSAAPANLMDSVVGTVELRAGDAGLLRDFYERTLGLTASGDDQRVELADAQGRTLLRLDGDSAAGALPPRHPTAGLFHVAYRYPTRAALATALDRAMKAKPEFQGASDHGVSEAIYIGDPEGNGIELYWDRPFELWPMNGDRPAMYTRPLDLASVIADLPSKPEPLGADIGHIHLKAGELDPTTRFYAEIVGLDFRQTYPGASFLAEGLYHHHVAANTWQSAGAAPARLSEPGLSSFELQLSSPDAIEAAAARAEEAGLEPQRVDGGVTLRDPDSTLVNLRTRS